MFKRACKLDQPVSFEFAGQTVTAQAGDTVAAALLAAGIDHFRNSTEDQTPRGVFCMVGNCFECLVEIEGLGSRQACRERIAEGMRVRRHPGKVLPGVEDDEP